MNLEQKSKHLGRRELLGKIAGAVGGIALGGLTSGLLSSCGTDDINYNFKLSELPDWMPELFLQAGRDYWESYPWVRDDSSRNRAYLGEIVLSGASLQAGCNTFVSEPLQNGRLTYIPETSNVLVDPSGTPLAKTTISSTPKGDGGLEYTFTIVFNQNLNWVNCDIFGESGQDFYIISAHELGHVVSRSPLHSQDPYHIMFPYPLQRC